ncbi:MAG TPA: cellulose synthase complex periplasmic endoglucanase BcsZ [Steroidobacteraceae bacterium]|nr:cellulose synthase complex periplasmic endoglucanase BcsZ [Steroidobacteraceae bacterium]
MNTLARRGAMCAALLFVATAQAGDGSCERWRQWQEFKRLYLSEDGRVIDASTPQVITVSEGQAYALMFALIANDPATFVKILRWTQDNMAGGNLERSLPAWKWGRADDGKWSVLDRNPAADADLWMSYALAQGARLWHNAGYAQLAHAMAELILREEVSLIPGLGATLLPGAKGFVVQQTWRLNASYAPIEVLRALGRLSDERQWAAVLESSQRVIAASAPRGFAADWILYRESGGFSADATTAGVGSYNAIRVYLWAGMLAEGDPQAAGLAQQLKPMAAAAAQRPPPASIDTNTLEARGEAPPGFLAALLPLLVHFKFTDAVQAYRQRIEAESLKDNQHYYSDALTLFGLGWLEGRFHFDRHGELQVAWTGPCRAP